MGGSSAFSVVVVTGGETGLPLVASWIAKASSGTLRSGEQAVPRISPVLSSQHPEGGMFCRPEATNDSVVAESSDKGIGSTM